MIWSLVNNKILEGTMRCSIFNWQYAYCIFDRFHLNDWYSASPEYVYKEPNLLYNKDISLFLQFDNFTSSNFFIFILNSLLYLSNFSDVIDYNKGIITLHNNGWSSIDIHGLRIAPLVIIRTVGVCAQGDSPCDE